MEIRLLGGRLVQVHLGYVAEFFQAHDCYFFRLRASEALED